MKGFRNINLLLTWLLKRKHAENLLTSLDEDYSLYPPIDGVKGRHRYDLHNVAATVERMWIL